MLVRFQPCPFLTLALPTAATQKITENANELVPKSVFKAIEERRLGPGVEPKRGHSTFGPISYFSEESGHIDEDGYDLERALIRLLRGGRVSTQSNPSTIRWYFLTALQLPNRI